MYYDWERSVTEEFYTITHTVSAEEVTMTGTLRISSLFALFQYIAGLDVERLGYGDSEFRKQGILWMLTRMRTRITRMPDYNETITVRTWTGRSGHGLYTRHYELCDVEGEPLVSACGIWVLVDSRKRQLIREPVCRFADTVTGRELPAPRHLRLSEPEEQRTMDIAFCMCDLNGHLSNLRYPDLAESVLPIDYLKTHTPALVDVDYFQEVRPETPLRLQWRRDGDSWEFAGIADSPCFQLRLEYQ